MSKIFIFVLMAALVVPVASSQTTNSTATNSTASQNPNGSATQQAPPKPETPAGVPETATKSSQVPAINKQPKRILGMMPNYRAVSAGELPPPPTAKQSLKLATQNNFDYSSFIFVGITSLLAEATDTHPPFGKGVGGFGNYYWHGFLDKTTGNYLVVFAYPTIFREDERYYAMGQGGFLKRSAYAASRVLITPNYHGHNTANLAEIFGRATSEAISTAYYPESANTFGAVAARFGWAVGRDALTNVFREWWPDIAVHVLHRKP